MGTLDDLILGEARSDIAHIYENLYMPMVGYRASARDEEAVMGRFLVAYISGFHEEDGNYQEMLKDHEATFFSWKDVKMFAEDQQRAFDMQRERQRPFASGLSFDDHVDVAQDFIRNFMAFQHTECSVWKNKLLDLEYQGSGRVRLVDFYSGRHRSDWSFLETQDYLRAIGALDESVPGKPSVIIPNYITAPSNCLSPSEFYNVCCRDECEGSAFHGPGDCEAGLVPLFDTLPKNELGNLDGPSVRYALHRFFTKKHGWSVKGLSREGRSWNASSPTAGVMKEQVPMYLHSLDAGEQIAGDRTPPLRTSAFARTIIRPVDAPLLSKGVSFPSRLWDNHAPHRDGMGRGGQGSGGHASGDVARLVVMVRL